jgi:hypothetical protein
MGAVARVFMGTVLRSAQPGAIPMNALPELQLLGACILEPQMTTGSKEIDMNRKLASALTIATMAAAVLAFAAIASGKAYADDITTDNTPFVSSKTRAEVRAEVMGQSELLRIASSEWSTQLNEAPQPKNAYTREQAKAEYIAARNEVNARNAEDSGSSSFEALPRRMGPRVVMAGPAR